MTLQFSLLLMKFWWLLPINAHGQYVGTLSLQSSLESSNRIFACPLESVAFTCSINGTSDSLRWDIQRQGDDETIQVGHFRESDTVGEGFLKLKHLSCHGDIIFSGVLINISDSILNSSMIVIPSLWTVPSDSVCNPLTIICKTLDPGAEANTMNMTYKVAARPQLTAAFDDHNSCEHRKHSQDNVRYCLITTRINVTDMLMTNKATEISYVSIRVVNLSEYEHMQPHNFSISPTTKFGTLNATFQQDCLTDKHIAVNILVFDKCGQQSIPKVINCTFSESEVLISKRKCDELKYIFSVLLALLCGTLFCVVLYMCFKKWRCAKKCVSPKTE